jgi:transcriptional regulator with XRE-family HTH domain
MNDLDVLRRARLAAGLTFREVGEAARLDPTMIVHCEAGRARPSAEAARRWQRGLAKLLAQRVAAASAALLEL